MTKNERTARGLFKIKAELSESATIGELIRAWTAYLDEQDLVIPMNYNEMAREMAMVASRVFSGLPKLTNKETEHCAREFIVQLKELLTVDGEDTP